MLKGETRKTRRPQRGVDGRICFNLGATQSPKQTSCQNRIKPLPIYIHFCII